MTTFAPIRLTCPACGTNFKSLAVGSFGYASKRSDLRPNYWGMNPVGMFYHLCPFCGFCGKYALFLRRLDHDVAEAVGKFGRLPEDVTLGEKIERAAVCLEKLVELGAVNASDDAVAKEWLEAFWWAEDGDQRRRFGELALAYFAKALNGGELSRNDLLWYLYLTGEINRRLGRVEAAAEAFDRVVEETRGEKGFEVLRQLARRQRDDPQDHL